MGKDKRERARPKRIAERMKRAMSMKMMGIGETDRAIGGRAEEKNESARVSTWHR